MMTKAMPQRPRADGKGKPDHDIFKKSVVDDVDTQYRQRGYSQRQDGAMNSTEDGSVDSQGIPVYVACHY